MCCLLIELKHLNAMKLALHNEIINLLWQIIRKTMSFQPLDWMKKTVVITKQNVRRRHQKQRLHLHLPHQQTANPLVVETVMESGLYSLPLSPWPPVVVAITCTPCLSNRKRLPEQAEQRILQLENKLSATGEEIGESTVALQVKVTELTNKTNELWEQMDKLWASAWRRNQQEIADLGDRVGNVQKRLEQEHQLSFRKCKIASGGHWLG